MDFHPIEIGITAVVVFAAAAYLIRYTVGIINSSKCQRSGCDSCKAKLKVEEVEKSRAT